MKNSLVLTAVLAFFLLGCMHRKTKIRDNHQYLSIEKAHWLLGTWQNKSTKGLLTEVWTKANDSTLTGQSYFIAGMDTLFMENIRLEQRNGQLSYIPTVRDQNNGQAVYFTLTRSTDSTLVFENPKHDFPQKITYQLLASDSLLAEVSAIAAGKLKSQGFRMSRFTRP